MTCSVKCFKDARTRLSLQAAWSVPQRIYTCPTILEHEAKRRSRQDLERLTDSNERESSDSEDFY